MDAKLLSIPVAILPGLLCDSRLFAGQLAAFPNSLVVDGFYGGARSLEAMADYALARLPGRFALLGHSMGARVALEVLRKAPDRIERLVLASTGVHALRDGEAASRLDLLNLGRSQGIDALIAAWLQPMLAPASRSDTELVASLSSMCRDAGLATYEAQISALIARPEEESLLPSIRCPTLVVAGSLDSWSPPAQHEAIAAAIPGAKLQIVAGAGHMLPAECPEEFNTVLASWLAQPSP